MRLLSQDGCINVPFDKSIISQETDGDEMHLICARMIGDLQTIVLATYPHEYQATFAMKMLNLKYNTASDGLTTYHFPSETEIKRMMGKA